MSGKTIKRKEEMFPLIEQWEQSGQNQREFCQRQQFPFHIFHYWLRKYRDLHSVKESSTGFIPVSIDSASSGNTVEIQYPSGVLLRLPATVEVSVIKSLLSGTD